MIKTKTKPKTTLITPENIRKNPNGYAEVIRNIQGQSLYKDLTTNTVRERIQQTKEQEKQDLGIYDYAILEHDIYGPIAVTSTITYTQDLPRGHKLHPETTYLTKENNSYTQSKLRDIVDTAPPIAEITGLARDVQHRGEEYGQTLSDQFTKYLQQEEKHKLITRFSLGKYAEGYRYSESKHNLENMIKTQKKFQQQDLEENNIPGLPYVHPISVPAAIAARNQRFKAIAARIPNTYKKAAEGHGGPLWIPEDSKKTAMTTTHTPTLLGERNGTYTTLN